MCALLHSGLSFLSSRAQLSSSSAGATRLADCAMPSYRRKWDFNQHAAQIRIISAKVDRALSMFTPFGNPTGAYEAEYKDAQWQAHQQHLRHRDVSGSPDRNSGLALWRARPFLSDAAFHRHRNTKRHADSMRHPDGQVWRPVAATQKCSVKSLLNPLAVEFSPLGIDSMLSYFLPELRTTGDDGHEDSVKTEPHYAHEMPAGAGCDAVSQWPVFVPSVPLGDAPLVAALPNNLGGDGDAWTNVARDVLWQLNDCKAHATRTDAFVGVLQDRLTQVEVIENTHHVCERKLMTKMLKEQEDSQMLLMNATLSASTDQTSNDDCLAEQVTTVAAHLMDLAYRVAGNQDRIAVLEAGRPPKATADSTQNDDVKLELMDKINTMGAEMGSALKKVTKGIKEDTWENIKQLHANFDSTITDLASRIRDEIQPLKTLPSLFALLGNDVSRAQRESVEAETTARRKLEEMTVTIHSLEESLATIYTFGANYDTVDMKIHKLEGLMESIVRWHPTLLGVRTRLTDLEDALASAHRCVGVSTTDLEQVMSTVFAAMDNKIESLLAGLAARQAHSLEVVDELTLRVVKLEREVPKSFTSHAPAPLLTGKGKGKNKNKSPEVMAAIRAAEAEPWSS